MLDYHRDKDWIENFCKDLKQHLTKTINNEEKKMVPSTYEEDKSYHKQNVY